MTDELFDPDKDVLERSAALDRQILAIPAEKVFTKRAVTIWGTVIVAFQLVLMALSLNITSSTNRAVTGTIAEQDETIAKQEELIAGYEAVLGDAVDAILAMQDQIRALGGTPPEVVLRAPEPEENGG